MVNAGGNTQIRIRFLPPAAPTAATATVGDGQETVNWTAPVDDGGSPVTGYTVTSSPGGQTCTVAVPQTSCTVIGLTNGTAYTFTVTATNAAGTGVASGASNSVTPYGLARCVGNGHRNPRKQSGDSQLGGCAG